METNEPLYTRPRWVDRLLNESLKQLLLAEKLILYYLQTLTTRKNMFFEQNLILFETLINFGP